VRSFSTLPKEERSNIVRGIARLEDHHPLARNEGASGFEILDGG
jgi:hypothetical protein